MPNKNQQENKAVRPPIIVVMGHIDHGKSQLLDYIRESKVVEGEAGGITQHMYAYEIDHTDKKGQVKRMTFLDTPGHEAFTLMRSRGARMADIAILVIAADDGVKQQTREALNIIKESGIPFIVAINKMDLPSASADRVKQELSEQEVFLEGYGGQVSNVEISAKTGKGVDELIELLSLIAEMESFTGDKALSAEGFVIESHRDPQKGVSATLLIHNGTVKKGMYVVAGVASAPVRAILNFKGESVGEAHFSSPVRISGFNETPSVGAPFRVFSSKKEAEKYLAGKRDVDKQEGDEAETQNQKESVLGGKKAILPLVIKADVEGTLEAVLYEIKKLDAGDVSLQVIESGVGAVSESDIKRASGVTLPLVVGFNVAIEKNAEALARGLHVSIETFDIIYRLVEYLEEEVAKRKPKMKVEETLGKAKIIRIFSKTKDKQVVGGKVREGKLRTGSQVKILRRDIEIARGKILELQEQKVKTDEVLEGSEFGSMIESREHDIAEGDYIESFEISNK
ncbi:MAG: translation initiation factor IF-2 [Candidatus Paceibacterota bacterium]